MGYIISWDEVSRHSLSVTPNQLRDLRAAGNVPRDQAWDPNDEALGLSNGLAAAEGITGDDGFQSLTRENIIVTWTED